MKLVHIQFPSVIFFHNRLVSRPWNPRKASSPLMVSSMLAMGTAFTKQNILNSEDMINLL